MSDETHGGYEPPALEPIDTEDSPTETAAGVSDETPG